MLRRSLLAYARTRILIISDTHGIDFNNYHQLRHVSADLAIHCGDLTERSKLDEFRTTVKAMSDLKIPQKLVIAGNHDITLDEAVFAKHMTNVKPPTTREQIRTEYGSLGEVRKMFEEAREAGIMLLNEGTSTLRLENGATIKFFASPFVPLREGWAFRYNQDEGHDFAIEPDTDIAITHAPPRGIMDKTHLAMSIGSTDLLKAIIRTKPLLHCFGHVHEGRGASYATWKQPDENRPQAKEMEGLRHTTLTEAAELTLLYPRATKDESLKANIGGFEGGVIQTNYTNHALNSDYPVKKGTSTLFVNAAMKGSKRGMLHRPWLVELDLPLTLVPAQ